MRIFCRALILAVFLASALNAAELSVQHRSAELMYNAGNYKAASEKAEEILKYFPSDLQALIIKGKSEFQLENYRESGELFARAARKAPKHPIVLDYSRLLREIDYRTGAGASITFDQQLKNSPVARAEYFRKAFFGTGFTFTSGSAEPPAATAPLALPTPYPNQETILSEEPVYFAAQKAFDEGNYNKAYLFFGQLLATQPSNKKYLLRRAESAFHMKRYEQVIKLLGPALTIKGKGSFTDEERLKAETLVKDSRNTVYSQ